MRAKARALISPISRARQRSQATAVGATIIRNENPAAPAPVPPTNVRDASAMGYWTASLAIINTDGDPLNLEAEMLKWSQTVYGVAHSLHLAHSLKLGNLTALLDSLDAAESWNQSNLGFQSCLPSKEFREGSINLDGRDHEEIFKRLSENIVQVLFINLAVLADECLDFLIRQAGVPEPPNYLSSKAEWVKARLTDKYKWAANGLLELCAVRNALVHAGGRLNPAVVAILDKAGVKDAKPEHEVRLSFGDLFRYRRALRTVFGELEKLKAA